MLQRSTWRRSSIISCLALSLWAGVGKPCEAQTAAPAKAGVIAGRVLDSLGTPVAGAIVTLDTLSMGMTVDAAGGFRFLDVPAGRRTLTVHVLGAAPIVSAVDVTPGDTTNTIVRAGRVVTTLAAVKSRAVGEFGKPVRLSYTSKYDEFYRRRAMSSTSAQFLTHEDLEKMGVADLPDMLRRIPHLRVRLDPDRTELSFPGCTTNHILIMLDDQRVWPPDSLMRGASGSAPTMPRLGANNGTSAGGGRGEDPLELIATLHLQNIEAMEVYKDMASLPFDAVGEVCGAIYIWTR